MFIFCIIIICLILLLSAVFHKYRTELIKPLARKEHPLKFLYPAAARVYDLAKGIFRFKPSKSAILMKQLCVKENIDSEMYIFTLKKISSSVGIILAACAAGVLLCINNHNDHTITSLSRASYGQGKVTYQLDADYEGQTEAVEISLDAVKRTPEELEELFDRYYPMIIKTMLGENKSTESVSLPLDLINSYEGIRLHWEIEDTSLIDYNGELSKELKEGELVPANLFVTLSADDISQTFSVPLLLTAPVKSASERLNERIMEDIESNNTAYDSDVVLPGSLDGQPVSFSDPKSTDVRMILIFAGICAVAVFFLYNKKLEDRVRSRNDQMIIDFTEIVFKLSLLYEAGLSIFRAWERIVDEHDADNRRKGNPEGRYAYREMRLTLEQIRNGAGEAESYGQFGKRCGLHQYIKLGNILEQNLTKGARGMKALLRQEAQDAFEERKRTARRKGEEASTRMLIPMVMMLIVVMVIVAVPALMSIGF